MPRKKEKKACEWREAGTDVVGRGRELDVAAFVVSLLFVHMHPYVHTQAFVTRSAAGPTFRSSTPCRAWVLSTELSSSIACVCRTAQLLLPALSPSVPDTGCQELNLSGFLHKLMKKDSFTYLSKQPIAQFCPLSEIPLHFVWKQMWEAESWQALPQHNTLSHPGSRCSYLITILDELLPADVGHNPCSQGISQDVDHCSKPVSGK